MEMEQAKIQKAIDLECRRNTVLEYGYSTTRSPRGFDPKRIQSILTNMEQVLEDGKLQEFAFTALQNIVGACQNDAIRRNCVEYILEQRGIPILLQSLASHSSNRNVQAKGLSVLVQCTSSQSIDHYEMMLSEGGIDVIIKAMTHCPGSVEVATKSLTLLQGFSRQSLDFQRVIFAKGGISLILGLMQRHFKESSVQEKAFACLRNTALHPENRSTIAEQGGIPVILSNMEHYSRDAAIQAYGCDALGRMALGEDKIAIDLQAKILGYGGLDIATAAMSYHKVHSGVQDRAIFLLLSLSANEDALARMKSSNVLEKVRNAQIPNNEAALGRCRLLATALQPKGLFEMVAGWR